MTWQWLSRAMCMRARLASGRRHDGAIAGARLVQELFAGLPGPRFVVGQLSITGIKYAGTAKT
jgi:hypothetical protein